MDSGQPPSLASSQPFTVFVLELVSSGYFGDDISESFRREGRAMLDAVLEDFLRIPGVRADTISMPIDVMLLRAAAQSIHDATLIIAPEFDGLLEFFCNKSRESLAKSLNCEIAALKLAGDKWAFASHLLQHEMPSIPTQLISLDDPSPEFPCVIKPRYGAGSWLVRLIPGAGEYAEATAEFRQAGLTELICQPFILGRAYSIAALVRPNFPPDILPVAEQQLSDDGKFRYLGGTIPADLPLESSQTIQQLMGELIASIPGLNGYIGCDVIVPELGNPLIVELNPRMTTSCIGYRRLCEDNLMERLLFPDRFAGPLRWKPSPITFTFSGT